MKTIYKKCDDCDGKGYFFMPYPKNTTAYPLTINQPLVMSESTKCYKCNGTGRIETGYIDEQTNEMNIHDLIPFKDQHGRLIYTNKLGLPNTLFGYIREVNCDYIIWQDNEKPDTFKIKNIISFDLVKLTNIKT